MEINSVYIAIIGWTSVVITILTVVLLYTNWQILKLTKAIHVQASQTRKEVVKLNIVNKKINRSIGGY
jgi:hypothetical protein